MNKLQEIAHLDAFIASLPGNSYLAHWMHHAAAFIKSDIQNDIFPTVLPSQARAEAFQIVQTADQHKAKVIAGAEKRAAEIIQDAELKADRIRQRLSAAVANADHAARMFMHQLEEST